MISRTTVALAALAVFTASSFAQTPGSALSIRIQATFRAADVNKNGTISIREAAAAGIPPVSFATHDLNKDRRLSSNEFEDYYQRLLVVRRQEQAARVAANAAKRAGQNKKPLGGTEKPVPVVGPKVEVLPGQPATKSVEKVPAAKEPEQGNPDGLVPLDELQPELDPNPTAGVQPTGLTKRKAVDADRKLVSDFEANGKLSAADAKALMDALSMPQGGKDAAGNFAQWREALNNARARIGALVQAKGMTAEDGRELYLVLEKRAQDAVRLQQNQGVTPVAVPSLNDSAKLASKEKETVQGKEAPKPAVGKQTEAQKQKPTDPILSKDETVAAANRTHDQQRIKDARARIAEQQAKELAAKEQALKEQAINEQRIRDIEAKRNAARDAAKGVSDPKPLPKGISEVKSAPGAKPAPEAIRRAEPAAGSSKPVPTVKKPVSDPKQSPEKGTKPAEKPVQKKGLVPVSKPKN